MKGRRREGDDAMKSEIPDERLSAYLDGELSKEERAAVDAELAAFSTPEFAAAGWIASLDAFVFVMPEYNYSTAPALTNAIDYVFVEWNYKALGLVSYGGISAGLRAAQMVKLTAGGVKMVAIAEAVSIPFAGQAIDKDTGAFKATDAQDKSAAAMLDELARWTTALAGLRA